MSTVILAEKPSQALAYASALKQSNKKDGYFEIKDPIFVDETFITFGFGHLVELAEPGHYEEKWPKTLRFKTGLVNGTKQPQNASHT